MKNVLVYVTTIHMANLVLDALLLEHSTVRAGNRYRQPRSVSTVQILKVWHRRFSVSPSHVRLRQKVAELLAPLDAST